MKTNAELQKALAVHLVRSLGGARRDYRRRLKHCREKISGKAVHDLRVETRRLLALLDFLEAARFDGSADKPGKLLKKRLDAFDELRDTHVQLQLLEPLGRKFPEAKPLKKFLQRQEQKLIRKMRKKVKRMKLDELSSRLKEVEKQICAANRKPQAGLRKSAVVALQKSFDCVLHLRRRIHGQDAVAIHRMRVAFKRFRYMSEWLRPFLPWVTKDQLRRMRKFQASAGAIQDLEILLARWEEFIREKKLSAVALRSLRNELARRKHRAMDFFMKRMDDLLKFQPDGHAAGLGVPN